MKSKLEYLKGMQFHCSLCQRMLITSSTDTRVNDNTFELHVMLLSHYEGLKYFVLQEVGLVIFHRFL